ncbi:SDR family oxidoreductase [Acetobacter sp. TBRC 12305]|uniref:SDR family oxidoreductase n=1 Tax=Acetobacter garciniae TaxID=2817435 RepID=A0A939KP81_9PROT|nr:glucose 1-dehydrogenase [Acetobacter garciniae]MBO1323577.1 SDR family oxidoreductase [Acetobacter garciniae]MBX0343266.1 SDR family oxidoreductase [Acetobacter garciniae]
MGRVSNKVAFVSGAASGIGKAAACLLAREGAAVVIGDVDEKDGQEVIAEIEGRGGKALFVTLDVQKEEDWQVAIETTLRHFGRLDIAVNNAGIVYDGTVESTSLEDWQRVQSINLDGVFLGTKYAIAAICRHGDGGSIINLSSIGGLVGIATRAAYNASKGGIRLLTKSCALHCAQAGYKIRVNSLHPGYIWTQMVEDLTRDDDPARQKVIDQHPLGHLGSVDDAAYGILYLASDESKFMTGSELVIDGGYTAQ